MSKWLHATRALPTQASSKQCSALPTSRSTVGACAAFSHWRDLKLTAAVELLVLPLVLPARPCAKDRTQPRQCRLLLLLRPHHESRMRCWWSEVTSAALDTTALWVL